MKLVKIVNRRKKRLGQGGGSGKGFHTASRGVKGQKARSKIHIMFEGYKMKKSLLRRLPVQRGKGRFKRNSCSPIVINLEVLNIFPDGTKVNLASLIKAGIVKEKEAKMYGVKLLGGGKLVKKLTVDLPMSKSATQKLNA